MRLTCEEESSLTTRDGDGVRFVGSPDGQVTARDTKIACPGTRPTAPARFQAAGTYESMADRLWAEEVEWQAPPDEDD